MTARRGLARAALTGAVVGAVAGPIALVVAYTWTPQLTLDLDRDHRPVLSGVHDAERAGDETFAWTRRLATLDLAGLDRRQGWTCTFRVRAGRGEPLVPPVIALAVDGRVGTTHQTTNALEDVTLALPADATQSGARVTLTVADTFQPGPGDDRELGVQIDRITCAPEAGLPWPPARALLVAGAAAATFGLAAAVLGLGGWGAALTAVAVGGALAMPIASGIAPYAAVYLDRVWWCAMALAASAPLVVIVGRGTRGRWSFEARTALLVTSAAAFLKLSALIHPSKLVVDAVFQAHRLQWILDGRFYFTQPMPDGVQFPYAIALYLFAAPFTWLTDDYVTLLRVVVVCVESASLALLYTIVAGVWRDRAAGVVAVLIGHLVPLPFVVIGNANLPNVFGQGVALMSLAAAVLWPLASRAWAPRVGLFAIAAVAMLSHVSTAALAGTILGTTAVLWMVAGGPELRRAGRAVLACTAAATVFSVVTYYGHFGEVYQRLERLRPAEAATAAGAGTAPAGIPTEPPPPADAAGPDRPAPATPTAGSMVARAAGAAALTVATVGWPVLVLGALGVWARRGAWRDPLSLAIVAMGLAYLVFSALGVVPTFEGPFERYVVEFIGRVVYATYPAAVVLAATGVVWSFRRGWPGRGFAALLVSAAVVGGGGAWLAWLR